MKRKKALLYADGASLGNPGPSGIGAVLLMGADTFEISEHIGVATNNVAEYEALLRGLQKAKEHGAEELSVYLDSELLVRQMTGLYRVKDEKLRALHRRASALAGEFAKISITHIPREKNKKADTLAKNGAARKKHPKPAPPRSPAARDSSRKGEKNKMGKIKQETLF